LLRYAVHFVRKIDPEFQLISVPDVVDVNVARGSLL
jgi:hypothetical protein